MSHDGLWMPWPQKLPHAEKGSPELVPGDLPGYGGKSWQQETTGRTKSDKVVPSHLNTISLAEGLGMLQPHREGHLHSEGASVTRGVCRGARL